MNGLNAMAGIVADNALSVRVQKAALEQRASGFRIVLDDPEAVYHPGDEVKVSLLPVAPALIRSLPFAYCWWPCSCCSDTMELFAQEMVVWSAARAAVLPSTPRSAAFPGGLASEPRPSTSLPNESHFPSTSQDSPSSVHPPSHHHHHHQMDVPTVNVMTVEPDSPPTPSLPAESVQDSVDDGQTTSYCSGSCRSRASTASKMDMPQTGYLSRLRLAPLLRSLGLTACTSSEPSGHSVSKSASPRSGSAVSEDGRLTPFMSIGQPGHQRLRSVASMEEPNQLGKGFHRFPFQFVLPTPNDVLTDMPSTFYESLTFIRYELAASYAQPWPKPRRHVSIDLPVQSRVPVNRRRLEQPAEAQNSAEVVVGGFWTRMGRAPKGRVSCKVSLPRTGFLLGEDLPVSIEVRHFCELHQVEGVLVELRRRQTVNMGTNTERISRTISFVIEPMYIDAATLTTRMTVALPTDAMEPPSTMRRDSPIHLSYYVMVSVFPRRGCHDTRLTVRVPIVMANYHRPTPSSTAQQGRSAQGQQSRHRTRMSLGEPLPLYTRVAERDSMAENIRNDILAPPPSYDMIALPPTTTQHPATSTTALDGSSSGADPDAQADRPADGDDIMEEVLLDSDEDATIVFMYYLLLFATR
ncbi:hypothetical protein SYNPS1DRAFT_27254 [Syncephalis pseudoplumigaleata]|uniref:Arrestin C-terminal-like domain-containing protein n=1 Tax=Syncephalis pseudoplumigaleata TaxID=1712513 RepID=A0A4P9Z3E8_9FUNG|nr:hypothetical protein SYNPS1DRAFT_27254 [Syncephalis pseudoplumigaleata]|eukprot:RKP27077.1 hypothetical protein SYNPS1DRAFT_27254 [Syncephalis pseudoplumigaleata]